MIIIKKKIHNFAKHLQKAPVKNQYSRSTLYHDSLSQIFYPQTLRLHTHCNQAINSRFTR